MLTINDLHQYQKDAVNAVCSMDKLALFLDLGLGKTIISLTSIKWLIDKGKIKNVLIIAPKTVAETVWPVEISLWSHTKGLHITSIMGNPKQRTTALNDSTAEVFIISRDNVAWLFTQDVPQIDMLIIDESTSFKGNTQRYSALMQKTVHIGGKIYRRKNTLISMFKRVLLLTATPNSEGYNDGIYRQVSLLFPHDNPLGKTITQFRETYMLPSYFGGPYPQYVKVKPGAIEAINKVLQPFCISMKKEKYLELPERIDIVRHIKSNNKPYEYMEKNSVVYIDNTDIIAGDVLTKYNKLQQLSAGFIYDEQGGLHVVNHEKEQVLQEMLESVQENVLVMYKYQYEKELLINMGGVPLDTPEKITQWKQGKIRIGLLYPASGGYGLNLASGGAVVIWFTLPLSLEQYVQSNGRIHRQGQTKTVRIYHLLATTIDNHIYQLLQAKKEVLQGLLNAFEH